MDRKEEFIKILKDLGYKVYEDEHHIIVVLSTDSDITCCRLISIPQVVDSLVSLEFLVHDTVRHINKFIKEHL